MDNMTALVSTFARAHHFRSNRVHVFADPMAEKMLTDEEYAAISKHMADGIAFFSPGFQGTGDEALRYIVDHQLAPSVLARSTFCERAMENAVMLGCRQIVIYACGYDTFSLRTLDRRLTVFELDKPEMIDDRMRRMAHRGLEPTCRTEQIGCDLSQSPWKDALIRAGFDAEKPSFGSLLGISYYLTKEEFRNLIGTISSVSWEGSSLCFDYPLLEGSAESLRNQMLAAAAGEQMKARYSYSELEELLSDAGFLIYEHMNAAEATDALFKRYNQMTPDHSMAAPDGVGYCLAVKRSGI